MTAQEIDEFLSEPRLCHFATIDDRGNPRVRPLWYLWRDGSFWLTTRSRARHTGRDLEEHPRVAVSVASEDAPYRTVIAHGRVEVLDRDEETLLAIATRYRTAEGRAWAARAMQEPDRILLRLVPDTVLSWNYAREHTDGPKRTRLG